MTHGNAFPHAARPRAYRFALAGGLRWLILAWLVASASYAPAVYVMNLDDPRAPSLAATFGLMLLTFLPWVAATPLLLRLCTRLPLGMGHDARNATLLLLAAIPVIPTATLLGNLSQSAADLVASSARSVTPARLLRAVVVTSFFSLPVYATIVGVGQTMLWMRRTHDRERLVTRARLDALRTQIDPHFLFNALNAIGELAARDPTMARDAIHRLADVLRSTLATDASHTTVAEEVAITRDHVELHRLLLPGELALSVTVTPAAWSSRLPALLLQPLLENAFVRALSRMPQGAWLTIDAKTEGGDLCVTMENALPRDGCESPAGLGLGLANVGARLSAAYGDRASLRVGQGADRFRVEVCLPLDGGSAAP